MESPQDKAKELVYKGRLFECNSCKTTYEVNYGEGGIGCCIQPQPVITSNICGGELIEKLLNMKPKEKANQLIDKFEYKVGFSIDQQDRAKECALICVDEIIDLLCELRKGDRYWQEVKQCINKL